MTKEMTTRDVLERLICSVDAKAHAEYEKTITGLQSRLAEGKISEELYDKLCNEALDRRHVKLEAKNDMIDSIAEIAGDPE